jgi:hypothetical protein
MTRSISQIPDPSTLTTRTAAVAKLIPSTTLLPNVFGNRRPSRSSDARSISASTRIVIAATPTQRFLLSSRGSQSANSRNRNATTI